MSSYTASTSPDTPIQDVSATPLSISKASPPSTALHFMHEAQRCDSSVANLPFSAVQRQGTRTESSSRARRRALKKIHDNGSKQNTGAVALHLMNNGNVARDHLASERTFLAYVRTSLGMASAGVALIQFLRLGTSTKAIAAPIGGAMVVASIIVLLLGTRRFFLVQKALVEGFYPTPFLDIILIGLTLGCIIIGVFCIVVRGGLPKI